MFDNISGNHVNHSSGSKTVLIHADHRRLDLPSLLLIAFYLKQLGYNTVIGSNTFLDNQVHVAHNVKIGNNCMIAGQVGFAGSSVIGNNVVIGGQAGISGHLNIGNNVSIGGGSGVIKNVPSNSKIMGYPAIPFKNFVKKIKENV